MVSVLVVSPYVIINPAYTAHIHIHHAGLFPHYRLCRQGVGMSQSSSSSSSGIARNASNVSLGGTVSGGAGGAAAGGAGDVDAVEYAEGNQFVGVLAALIALRCLPLAMKMVRLLEEHHVGIGAVQPHTYPTSRFT